MDPLILDDNLFEMVLQFLGRTLNQWSVLRRVSKQWNEDAEKELWLTNLTNG